MAGLHGSIATQSVSINVKISANGSVVSSVAVTNIMQGGICYGVVQYNTKNANVIITKLNTSYASSNVTTVYYGFKNISSSEVNTTVVVDLLYLKSFYMA